MSWWKLKPPKSYQKLKPCTIEAWLVSNNPVEQRLAEEALEQLGVDAATNYLSSLLTRERQGLLRRLWTRVGVLFVVVIVGFVLAHLWHNALIRNACNVLIPLVNLFNIATPNVSRLQKSIVRTAAKSEHAQMVPVLLQAWYLMDEEVHPAKIEALIRLLPRLTHADRNLLDAKSRKQLNEFAQSAKKPQLRVEDRPFVISVLQALGNVRDETALPLMKEIANQEPANPEQEEMRRIARHYVAEWNVLPTSLQTAQPVEQKQILLERH